MLKVSVSDAIVSQNPKFITSDHPKFNEFIQEYYRYLEQQSNELSVLREVRDNIDIDRTQAEFLEKLKHFVLPVSIDNTAPIISDEELIKVLRELYLNKGTEDSLIFIMKKLFGNDSSVDYGRKYVLRPSDNEYVGISEIIIKNIDSNDDNLLNLQGSTITQDKAYAVIDSVVLVEPPFHKVPITGNFSTTASAIIVSNASNIKVGDILVSETYLQKETIVQEIDGVSITVSKLPIKDSIGATTIYVKTPYYKCTLDRKTIRNDFVEGIATTKLFVNNVPTFLDVVVTSNITNFDIIEAGSLYSTGQSLSLIGGDGYGASIIIDEISSGKVEDVIVVNPGTGYFVNDSFEVKSIDGNGKGATVEVEAIDGYGAELAPVMTIDPLTITINRQLLNYTVGDKFYLDVNDDSESVFPPNSREYFYPSYEKPTYEVLTVAGGTLGDYNWVPSVIKSGSNYPVNSKIMVEDGATIVHLDPIYTNIMGIDPKTFDDFIPNTTWLAPTIKINGSGAYGEVTITGNTITLITQTDIGSNYINPIVRLYTTNTYDEEIVGTHPQWNYFDINGDIDLSIVGDFSGYFNIANGTYYYKIEELTGKNCELSIDNLSYVTSFTSLYDGYFTNEIVDKNIVVKPVSPSLGYEGSINAEYIISMVNVVKPGINYLDPQIEINGVNGTLLLEANISDKDTISGVEVLDIGEGYFNATISVRGDGQGFVGTPILSGTIERVKVTNGGSGYTTATVSIVGDGIDAAANAVIDSGVITEIIITNKGSGYTDATVSIVGDGIDATATAIGGRVLGVNIVDGGIQWKNAIMNVISVDTVNTNKGSGAKLKPIITPKTGILNVTILP